MKIVFIGSTNIGFKCLEKIIRTKENVVAVYTLPRIFNISYSPKPITISNYKAFNSLTSRRNIPLITVRDKMVRYKDSIMSFCPDLIIVIGWYYLIPKPILEIPPLGCIGMHAGMLPKYRGSAPLSWAIINGEKETGISLFYLSEGIDDGDIIDQQRIKISEKDTIKTLYDKTNKVAMDMVAKNIPLIRKGKARRIKQDHSRATNFPPRLPENGMIDWSKSAKDIYNWVRAQTRPYPGAFFMNSSKKITVWSIKIPLRKKTKFMGHRPGKILRGNIGSSKNLIISCDNEYVIVTDYEVV